MSAETQTEADSTTSEEEVKKEVPKQEEAPVSSDGKVENSSNGLSLQLEEKIIRQVEVLDHVVTVSSIWVTNLIRFC